MESPCITLKELEDRIERTFIASVYDHSEDRSIAIGTLTQDGRKYLESISGLNMKQYVTLCIHTSDLLHIFKRHYGENEKDSALVPLTVGDVRNIAALIYHPGDIIYLGDDGKGKKFMFKSKSYEGEYALIEVYADRRGRLTAKSLYKRKKGVSQSVMSESRHCTSETYEAAFSPANIPIILELQDIPANSILPEKENNK